MVPGNVLSLDSVQVGVGPDKEGLLGGSGVLLLEIIHLEGGELIGVTEGEGHEPGSNVVNKAEEDAGVLLVEAIVETDYARHREGLDGQVGNVHGGCLVGVGNAGHNYEALA